ncbi:MAG: hypothetical protein U1C56_02550 [Candidatus Curtissbacteria bacterium]|nr:hypothetical protein [Candidatus Curtissbacteria bacterium]
MSEILLETKEEQPVANFAKKEKIAVPADILSQVMVQIPPVYYWEDVEDGQSVKMTMAFKIHGLNFGMSYPIEDNNVVKIRILRHKLFAVVKESLDVLLHHGTKILDANGIIDIRLVNEQEAIRYRYDKYWDKKVAAFNQLVKIAPITKKRALKLGLI